MLPEAAAAGLLLRARGRGEGARLPRVALLHGLLHQHPVASVGVRVLREVRVSAGGTTIEKIFPPLSSRLGSKPIHIQCRIANLSDCCAVGLFAGFHRIMSVMSWMASLEALGMRVARGVAVNCGNLKFMAAASLKPSPHSRLSGVPKTEQILKISSISELPGKSGRKVYSSAMMQPTALQSSMFIFVNFHFQIWVFGVPVHNMYYPWDFQPTGVPVT